LNDDQVSFSHQEIQYRLAHATDASGMVHVHFKAVHAIDNELYPKATKDAWSPLPSSARTNWLKEVILSNQSACHVATTSKNNVVGFSIFLQKEGILQALYVDPASSGLGIGRRLFTLTEDAARRSGSVQIVLKASLNAVAFYRQLQFIETGMTTQKLRDGSLMSAVAMEKKLVGTV
jgi:ribosomal protein S18 acetylase RimI-like enzyme